MAKKYLDYDGLLYFWQKIKTVFVPNTRKVNGKALSADITLTASDVSALPSSTTIPSPGTGSSYPTMDGTRALGSNAGYARVDHVHPSDTSRVPTSRTVNSKALSSNIVLTGSDIAADSTTSATIAETFAAMEDEFATALDDKVDKVDGKGLSTNDYTTTEKNKLAGIASGAEVNQNAFSNVTVGDTTIAADAKTDTLTLVAGSKITLTPDATNDQVTIAFNGTIPSVPSTLVGYGQVLATSSTALTTDAKVANASSFSLKQWGIVAVKFTNGCSTIRTLDVNGSGAKYIKYRSATTSSTRTLGLNLSTNYCALFMYDGTNYNLLGYEHGLATSDELGYMSSGDYSKLSAIADGAEVNQNAFSNITVGSTTIAADTKTDTLELVAGSNVTLTPDATNDKITISATDTTYESKTAAAGGTEVSLVTTGEKYLWNSKASTATATTSAAGLMSSSDKTKLNGIATGAEVNQNAFSNIIVGTSTIAADGKTDTLTLEGSNVTLTPDATNDKVTIGITASNVTTALGNTAVARATGDASGNNIASTYAPKASPALTGTPTAPTAAAGTNTTQIATTAFVAAAVTASGGEPNQNAFSKIKVGSTNVIADDPTDTLELVGSNVTLTPDGTDDKITIGITASNVTTALGNTAVARATADHMGNNINSIYAPKASPALSGTPTAPTAAAGTNTTQIATTAFVTSAIQTAQTGAATFQGTAPTSFAPTNYKKGYYWVVGTAGTYVTQTCEPGDMIFAIKDYGTAYAASDFNVIQTNLDITSIPNADIDTIVAS